MTRAVLFSEAHLLGSPSNGFKPLPLGRRYCTGFSSSVGGQTTLSPATTLLRLIWPLLWPHLHPSEPVTLVIVSSESQDLHPMVFVGTIGR